MKLKTSGTLALIALVEMQRLVQEHGSRRLEGITDIINCIEQRQLLDRIFQYAMRYNSMILGYRECPK